MSLIDCPDCGLAAVIVDGLAVNGTSGPIEHVKAHCPVLIPSGVPIFSVVSRGCEDVDSIAVLEASAALGAKAFERAGPVRV